MNAWVRTYCKNVSKEGYICTLYIDHKSEEHADNHHHHTWLDGE